MLWNTKEHSIDYLRFWYNITNFIQCIKYCLKCFTFIMYGKSLDVL